MPGTAALRLHLARSRERSTRDARRVRESRSQALLDAPSPASLRSATSRKRARCTLDAAFPVSLNSL
jgi:hypothetical protein